MPCRLIASIFLLGLSWSLLTSQEPTKRLADADIRKLVVGNWKQERKSNETRITSIDEFSEDGIWKTEATMTTGQRVQKLLFTGTWKVADGFLVEVIETSDPPLLKKGHESKDEVVAISTREMKCREKSGQELIRTRIQ